MIKHYARAAALAAALTMAMATMPAWADVKDYEFQLVSQEVKKGNAVIAVKLVHKPSGRAIPDAVIFAKRIDMGPDNMASMAAPLEPVPGGEPGVYQFKTNLEMAGRWALDARRQGAGRDGDGAEQADRQRKMTPLSRRLAVAAAIVVAAAAGYWGGHIGLIRVPVPNPAMPGMAQPTGPGHLLPRPQRAAVLFADAEKHRRRQSHTWPSTPART